MPQIPKIHFRTATVGNVDVFFREAGPAHGPVLLLLHGFPTSGHMFRNFMPALADTFHVIAPDLPGFGSTQAPPRGQFDYTFENLFNVIERFTDVLGLEHFALFVFDYGAPVGLRLATSRPERVTALISQNGNAYAEGLLESWDPIRAYWEDDTEANRNALRAMLGSDTTRFQYEHGVPEELMTLISPDAIAHDQAILDCNGEIQLDLFGDYKSNVALYPVWQEYLRLNQPPLLATWGRNDPFFGPAGAEAFKRDLPNAEVHFFETGHFALETHGSEIAELVRAFLSKHVER